MKNCGGFSLLNTIGIYNVFDWSKGGQWVRKNYLAKFTSRMGLYLNGKKTSFIVIK